MPPSPSAPVVPPAPVRPPHSNLSTKTLLSVAVCLFVLGLGALVVSGIRTPFFSQEIREGMYSLEGVSPGSTDQTPSYFGTVTIIKSEDVYFLHWQIGDQTQEGIGTLKNGVLSVSYVDTTGDTLNDTGVVSYQVTRAGLEGEWASHFGTGSVGHETLVWRSEIPPTSRNPTSTSGGAEEMDSIVKAIEYEASRNATNTSPNPYGDVYVEQSGTTTNVYVQ